MKKVTPTTRAGKNGINITCPKCNHTAKVYHLAWTRAGCHGCSEMIPKLDWKLPDAD